MTERKTIYRFQNGSQMYGLATPSSDVDYMEVFLPSALDLLGLREVEVIDVSTKKSNEDRRNTAEDVDDNRYSFKRYLQLLAANNPNILETLFVPQAVTLVREPEMFELVDNYARVVSKKSYYTFKGYAKSQEHKLYEKKARYDELVKAVAMFEIHKADEVSKNAPMGADFADALNATLKHYKGAKNNVESFHEGLPMRVIYEKMVEERDRYGWRVKTDTFMTLGYDTKFASHLVRLYIEAIELLTTGKIVFPFDRATPTFRRIMDVKMGEVKLDELQKLCNHLAEEVENAFAKTTLPETADYDWLNDYSTRTLLEHLRR